MNRLTKRRNGKLTLKRQFPTIQDTLSVITNRLELYEDLEEQGLLIKLPCKVGTELFHVRTEIYADGYSVEHKKVIKEIELTNHNIFEIKRNWNKTVFLTREEAEKALKAGD